MRHLWLLGLCFTVAACSDAPANGAVRVVLTYGSYVPMCLRITATDGEAHTGQVDITREEIQDPEKEPLKVRVAVYRQSHWGRELTIQVTSMDAVEGEGADARCAGNVIETLITPEPIVVPLKDFATFTATLQARDDDGDKHILKTQEVAGTDCDDTKATIHPGVPEACGGRVDYNCDGLVGCADTNCQFCDDGNACTEDDRCVRAEGAKPQCIGTPKTCAPPSLICFNPAPACNPETGECFYTPQDAGVPCEDSDACTNTGQCNGSGECKVEAPPACELRNECLLAARRHCPESAECTDWVNPLKVGQECQEGAKTGRCRSDGICGVFRFRPSNFDPDVIAPQDPVLDLVIACGTPSNPVVFDSDTLEWTLPQGCKLQNKPVAHVISSGGASVVVVPMLSLTIEIEHALKLIGKLPVILAVYGDVTLNGALLADADGKAPGAGGNREGCDAQVGGDGAFVSGTARRGGGGGGGGFGQVGAAGGNATQMDTGGRAGSSASGMLVPLVGGCQGGTGGARAGTGKGGMGGAGGGALQLAVAGTLRVNHAISVSGGGGQGGKGSSTGGENAEGGGGGGSGGGVLIEATRLQLTSLARITANGGSGAEGGDSNDDKKGADGNDGSQNSTAPAPGGDGGGIGAPGGDGGAESIQAEVGVDGVANGGAGGGGGGAGVIVIQGYEVCDLDTSCAVTDGVGCDISPKVTPVCP